MAWRFNPFTNNLDYYKVGGGSGNVDIIHVLNFSALPDPTTVSLYDVYVVDNEQGTPWLPGRIGGTYYPAGAYYSNLIKWVYSESASQATQLEVDSGTVTDKFVTPSTLNNYDRWATLLKKGTNIVTVDKTVGVGDFTSIATAVASITTASSTNPFVVVVNAGLYLEPIITMKSWITVKGDSSMSSIVEASSSSDSVFMMADQSMIIDLQVQGSTDTGVSAVVYSSSTTPQTNAIAYAENIRFGTNYTHAKTIGTGSGNCILQCSNIKYGGYPFTLGFHVTNDGSGIGRMQLRNVTSTNGGITTTTGLIFAKADQPSCSFIVNGCLLTKATGVAAGTGFWVENGASLRLTAVNFQRWATSIYAPNVGSAPSIYGTALNFENNTKDVLVEHPSATGKFEGTDTFLKTTIPIAAPIYEVNKDPRIITVAKKGGNFTSVAAAVNFITDSTITNRYIIQVGPGVFTEPVINLASHPYVSIVGANIETTQIVPDANNHDIILLGANNEVSFLTLQNAGAGYAGISVIDSVDYSQAHKVSFDNCSTGVSIKAITQDTLFYGEYIDFNGIYEYGVKVISSNGFSAFANLENYYNFSTGSLIAGTLVSGTNSEVKVLGSGHTSDGTGTAFHLINGAKLTLLASYVDYFNIGVYIENSGLASNAIITALDVNNSTLWDLFIEHPTASGTFNGSADHTKTNNVSSNFAWAYLDSNDAQFEITGKLAVSYPTGQHSDISTLLLEGGTMGLMEGGDLTDGGGFIVNVSLGYGYYELIASLGIILRNDWNNTSITLAANEDKYIYFDNTGILESNGSQPNTIYNILLGRVVTNGTGIELIDQVPANAKHTSNRYGKLFRNALGPIYASGSILSENITPFHLNVTGGSYYYASNEFNPVGGINILFTPTLNGIIQTPINTIPLSWDNAGTLTPLTAGQYAKHSVYVVGGIGHEKYYVVYGQTTFASLSAAESGVIPLPPTFIKDAITLIAGIIVTHGASNITEIIDQRPVIGFKAGGTSASSDHLSLSNLLTGDAGHTQFLMLDGSKHMEADLNMNTHAISNITTINSILPADWLKRGGNAYGTDTIIGLTDAFNLNIRTNNLTRIGVASSGEITIGDLTGITSGIIGATTTGQLTRSVSTTNLTEGTNLYFTDARAITSLLTGYISGPGTITTSDSILSAIEKLNGNISTLPRVTSVAELTLGTTGTDLSSTVANGTTTPVITLNVPTASATNRGVLSSTDWSTFNAKQNSLTIGNLTDVGTDGITITGGTGAVIGSGTSISQQVASATQNGYLSSADWINFNSAAPAFIPKSAPNETYRGININNNSTTVVSEGGITMSSTASTLAQAVASTNFATKQIRLRYYATTVSGGRYTGTRGSALLWYIHGGFRYVCDFNISDTAFSAGCQQFYGLSGVITDLNYGTATGILVSTLTNIIGIGSEVGDTNLQVFHNDATGTATKVDLGINFPANRTAGAISTTVYSIQLYNEPSSTAVKYEVKNNETGSIAQGTISTNLPLSSQGLNFFASRVMSTTSVTNTGQFDLSKLGVYSQL